MDRLHKAFAATTSALGPRQIRVTCTTGEVDRTGEQVVQNGIDLSGFLANPIILWQHDPEHPIGRASDVQKAGDSLQMDIEFAPEGISKKADEICGLVKAGVLNTVSIGFDPIETEAMNPAQSGKRNAPQRYLKIDLMEVSIVSIPANKSAAITQRQMRSAAAENWVCAPAKDLDVDIESDWNGREAAERILDDAGFNGDDPDPDKAKLGFLAYDSGSATLKGSYKLPFADIQKGKLVAVASGIRAAASRVSQTDIPDGVKKSAQTVIDAYEEKMAKLEDKKTATAPVVKGRIRRAGAPVVKDLYDIGQLAWLLASLGYAQTSARVETALEGDDSKLPAILAEVMQDLGAALIAMTEEEVGEAIAEAQGTLGQEEAMDDLAPEDAVLVTAGSTVAVRKFRVGFYRAKAAASRVKDGKKISAATADVIKEALAQNETAMDNHREAMKACAKSAACMKSLLEDTDTTDTQTSSGTGESDGSENGKAAAARRKAVSALRQKAA